MTKIHCTECMDRGEVNASPFSEESQIILVPCPACCEHSEHDHGFCLECGLDRSDSLVEAAEQACEGER